jgi:hypothetical protein
VPNKRSENDPRDRPGRTLAFHPRLGEAPVLEQRGQAAKEFTDANLRAMKVNNAFEKHRSCKDAAEENKPHQRSTLLHVFGHASHIGEVDGSSKSRKTPSRVWKLVLTTSEPVPKLPARMARIR